MNLLKRLTIIFFGIIIIEILILISIINSFNKNSISIGGGKNKKLELIKEPMLNELFNLFNTSETVEFTFRGKLIEIKGCKKNDSFDIPYVNYKGHKIWCGLTIENEKGLKFMFVIPVSDKNKTKFYKNAERMWIPNDDKTEIKINQPILIREKFNSNLANFDIISIEIYFN